MADGPERRGDIDAHHLFKGDIGIVRGQRELATGSGIEEQSIDRAMAGDDGIERGSYLRLITHVGGNVIRVAADFARRRLQRRPTEVVRNRRRAELVGRGLPDLAAVRGRALV